MVGRDSYSVVLFPMMMILDVERSERVVGLDELDIVGTADMFADLAEVEVLQDMLEAVGEVVGLDRDMVVADSSRNHLLADNHLTDDIAVVPYSDRDSQLVADHNSFLHSF